jgi:hypothetical protein
MTSATNGFILTNIVRLERELHEARKRSALCVLQTMEKKFKM